MTAMPALSATSLLVASLLLGMRHALEADHLAAVASLATRSRSLRSILAQGVAWGLGHTATLLAVGAVCLALRSAIPPRLGEALEAAVGVMLLGLGAEVLWRLRARRVHVHVHRHADGVVHLHAHSHAENHSPAAAPAEPHHHPPHPPHREQPHEHPHGLPRRALLVGLMHGLAGSAALLLVTLSTLTSAWLGLAYIAIFGAGSILGMAALSAAIALPLRATARVLSGWYNALEAAIAVITLLIGAWVIYRTPWLQELRALWPTGS